MTQIIKKQKKSNGYGEIWTLQLDPTPNFVPPHTRGDEEFAGHGPEVFAAARLMIKPPNQLVVRLRMMAEETQEDWTTAEGYREYVVFSDPTVASIRKIWSDTYSETRYLDTNHEIETLPLDEQDLVSEFRCVGDSKGDDAGTQTRMSAKFNPVRIEVFPSNKKVVAINPGPTARFIPPRANTNGDAEFRGHGPQVTVRARISVENGDEIWLHQYMLAVETVPDNTRAEGRKSNLLHKHSKPIKRIVSDTYSEAEYLDSNHDTDRLTMPPDDLVRRFDVDGDTAGDDAGVWTGMVLHFNPIWIEEA